MNRNQLIKKARAVVDDADNHHRYSIGGIYEVYNAITGRDEKKQNCSTCLLNKVKEIRLWLASVEGEGSGLPASSRKKRGGKRANTNLSS